MTTTTGFVLFAIGVSIVVMTTYIVSACHEAKLDYQESFAVLPNPPLNPTANANLDYKSSLANATAINVKRMILARYGSKISDGDVFFTKPDTFGVKLFPYSRSTEPGICSPVLRLQGQLAIATDSDSSKVRVADAIYDVCVACTESLSDLPPGINRWPHVLAVNGGIAVYLDYVEPTIDFIRASDAARQGATFTTVVDTGSIVVNAEQSTMFVLPAKIAGGPQSLLNTGIYPGILNMCAIFNAVDAIDVRMV